MIPGLPEQLPAGEHLIWRGAPDWKDLAVNGFHLRKLAVYFALLLLARLVIQSSTGAPLEVVVPSTLLLSILAAAVLGFIALYARLAARAARFLLTNRRIVIRCGATLPVTINLPFEKIESADLRVRDNGSGDLPLTLTRGDRPSWIILWPFVKPFSVTRVRPMLRSVPDAQEVGVKFADALRAYSDTALNTETMPRVVRDPMESMPGDLSTSGAS
ncbi:MAG: photosynthetic complex putative assembly protein PuhB [Pseudomonadota bacterium]